MTKTLATFSGIALALLGIAGLFDTSVVGTHGFIAANETYSLVLVAAGSLLLIGAVTDHARIASLVIGPLLMTAALAGFLIIPDGSSLFGFSTSSAGDFVSLAFGVAVTLAALFESATRAPREHTFHYEYESRDRTGTHQRYARYARHA